MCAFGTVKCWRFHMHILCAKAAEPHPLFFWRHLRADLSPRPSHGESSELVSQSKKSGLFVELFLVQLSRPYFGFVTAIQPCHFCWLRIYSLLKSFVGEARQRKVAN